MTYRIIRDDSPECRRLAIFFCQASWWHCAPEIKAKFRAQVVRARQRIPVDIRFVQHETEPYVSTEDMYRSIKREGMFRVRHKSMTNHVLGGLHQDFRAVHDWFGHVEPCNPFSFPGECEAYEVHRKSHMFDRDTLPLVWSEIVLENAFACYMGHYWRYYKTVYDPQWGKVNV